MARYRVHRFDQIWRADGIEQRLTEPNPPGTNGQLECMTYLQSLSLRRSRAAPSALGRLRHGLQLRSPSQDPERLSPYEFICNAWIKEPGRFILNPIQQMQGLNT
jgi:hypothetical protein